MRIIAKGPGEKDVPNIDMGHIKSLEIFPDKTGGGARISITDMGDTIRVRITHNGTDVEISALQLRDAITAQVLCAIVESMLKLKGGEAA